MTRQMSGDGDDYIRRLGRELALDPANFDQYGYISQATLDTFNLDQLAGLYAYLDSVQEMARRDSDQYNRMRLNLNLERIRINRAKRVA